MNENKIFKTQEIFIPGPAGRLEGIYYKSKKKGAPIVLILHPHPQFGGTMNNKIILTVFKVFAMNNFSVLRFNFRGVGLSDSIFDNGQGELSDAAAALDWIEKVHTYHSLWIRNVFCDGSDRQRRSIGCQNSFNLTYVIHRFKYFLFY